MNAIRKLCEWISRKRIESLRKKYACDHAEQRISLARAYAWEITCETGARVPLLNSTASNLRCALEYFDAGHAVRMLNPSEYTRALHDVIAAHINADNTRTILK